MVTSPRIGDTVFFVEELEDTIVQAQVESVRHERDTGDNFSWNTKVRLTGFRWFDNHYIYDTFTEANQFLVYRDKANQSLKTLS